MPMYGKLFTATILAASMLTAVSAAQSTAAVPTPINPTFTSAAAFDTTAPLTRIAAASAGTIVSARDDRDAPGARKSAATQAPTEQVQTTAGTGPVPFTTANFEGLSNQDNFNV